MDPSWAIVHFDSCWNMLEHVGTCWNFSPVGSCRPTSLQPGDIPVPSAYLALRSCRVPSALCLWGPDDQGIMLIGQRQTRVVMHLVLVTTCSFTSFWPVAKRGQSPEEQHVHVENLETHKKKDQKVSDYGWQWNATALKWSIFEIFQPLWFSVSDLSLVWNRCGPDNVSELQGHKVTPQRPSADHRSACEPFHGQWLWN